MGAPAGGRSVSLLTAFEESLSRHACVGRDWLVAVSGGPDSMALLRTALAAAARHGAEVTCGHIDHQLRRESGADAAWVVEQCAALGIRSRIERVTVASDGGAIEETARKVRYEALNRMALECRASAILTGHTADDNAETILHHVFRGTGLRGLVGIPPLRSLGDSLWLWRPLLKVRRSEVLTELDQLGQSYRTDSSNSSNQFTRNRVRRELIPWLERELNPRAVDAVLRLSDQSEEVIDWLHAAAVELLDRSLVQPLTPAIRLHCEPIRSSPTLVARECFVQLWNRQSWPRQAMTREHWQRLVDQCGPAAAPAVQMPGGIDVRRRGDLLIVTAPENAE